MGFCNLESRLFVWPPERFMLFTVLIRLFVACAGLCTVCVNPGLVLELKLESPPYDAVMECGPTASDDTNSEAWPTASSVPVPIDVLPSKNVTVPVIVPDVAEVTAAVNV